MKKNIIIMGLVFGLMMLSSCSKEPIQIAVLIYDLEDPFIQNVTESLERHQSDNVEVTIYDCQNSQLIQNEKAEELYAKGVDLLVVNPVDRLSSYIFIEKSRKEDVPVIFFNREPLSEDLEKYDQAYYVGANATESGTMQADMIVEYFNYDFLELDGKDLNGDGILQCVILKGEQGHQDAEVRTRVVIDTLENNGFDVEVLLTKVANWNESTAYRSMNEIMSLHGDEIELLISNNDAMAIGASKYLKDQGYYGPELNGEVRGIPFPIVGIDGLEEALDLVASGYMYGTIINDSDNMAKAILELSDYVLENKTTDLSYEFVEDKYIWISYKNHSNE